MYTLSRRAQQGKVELTQFRPLVVAIDAVADAHRDQLRRLLRPCGAHGQRGGHPEQDVAVENVDHGVPLVRGVIVLGKRH